MPINPVTEREQVYPTPDDMEEFQNQIPSLFQQTEADGKQIVSNLDDKYFSFLYAICHSKKSFEFTPSEKRLSEVRDLKSKMSEIAQNQQPEFSVWLSELIQNAMDAKWGNGSGATEIDVEFRESEVLFIHNGRPPQYLDYMKNEFQKMLDDGSTKRSDLNNEGKFGIGFKFWSFFFEEVNLECDGWQISWNKNNELSDVIQTDFNTGGMKLTFSKPSESYSSRYKEYEQSFTILFERDLARLIEGIAVQTTPLLVEVKLGNADSFKLDHKASTKRFKSGKAIDTQFYVLSNDIVIPGGAKLDLYAPSCLIGYDVNEFHNVEEFQEIENIVNTLQLEFEQKIYDPFIIDLLVNECENEDWQSKENLNKAAMKHRESIKCQCMIDIDPETVNHYVMYSLFSLSHKTGVFGSQKNKLNSRISYIGTYAVNQERTRLEQSNRNKSIVKAQLKSTFLLMNLISNEKFRVEYGISDRIYLEILASLEEGNFDSEFIALYKEE